MPPMLYNLSDQVNQSYVRILSCFSCVQLCDPMDCSLPGSMGFSRQEYWSVLPCPFLGDLPDPGIEPEPPMLLEKEMARDQGSNLCSLHWQADSLPLSHQGSPGVYIRILFGIIIFSIFIANLLFNLHPFILVKDI